MASLYFVLALELRLKHGFTAIEVGLMFGWLAVCFVTTSTLKSFKLLIGNRWAEIGLGALMLGHLVMWHAGSHLAGGGKTLGFILSCALQGAGIGCLMGRLMGDALKNVSPERSSVAGGIASTTQQIGNSMGIAGIGFVYFSGVPGETSLAGAVTYLVILAAGVTSVVLLARDPGRQ